MLWKKSSLEKRMEKVRKELSLVSSDISVLKRSIDRGEIAAGMPRLRTEGRKPKPAVADKVPDVVDPAPEPGIEKQGFEAPKHKRESKAKKAVERDDRLAEYLTGSFHKPGLMRNERSKQRNKALFMVIFFLIVLFLVLRNYF